ncbi:MAG: NAD(P)-dependent glycerol-3-phosphate dehydrogenase [Gammaproteobacteria bacterium]|nr:NAD(P)-dependent glycerol-3-phosphate dehydrogenase [Gammaproteobacteria bacterium]
MSANTPQSVAVIGAGSWGTALALLLAANGHDVRLWSHNPKQVKRLVADRCNKAFLPNSPFPDNLNVTDSLRDAVDQVALVLIVVPSQTFRQMLQSLGKVVAEATPIAWGTKGLEQETGLLLHQVAGQELPNYPLAVISGPTFATEVAAGLPGAVTVAAEDLRLAEDIAALLRNHRFRVYATTDMVGVELGGALKNVLAVATGVADGLGYGANTRAALITRGLAEILRLGMAMGGQLETFMGLAGVGDLVLTCTDDQSRNRRFGLALGRGKTVAEALAEVGQTVEGMTTAKIAYKLALDKGIDMPIATQVYQLIYENISTNQAVDALLERKPRIG